MSPSPNVGMDLIFGTVEYMFFCWSPRNTNSKKVIFVNILSHSLIFYSRFLLGSMKSFHLHARSEKITQKQKTFQKSKKRNNFSPNVNEKIHFELLFFLLCKIMKKVNKKLQAIAIRTSKFSFVCLSAWK